MPLGNITHVLTIGNIIPDCHSKWNIVLKYG